MPFKTDAVIGKKQPTSTAIKPARIAISSLPSNVKVLASTKSGDDTVAMVQDKGQVFEVRSSVLMTSEGSVVGYAQVYTIVNGIQPDAGTQVTKSGMSYYRYQLAHPMNSIDWSVQIVSASTGIEQYADVTKTTTQVIIDFALNPTENHHVSLVGLKV